MRYMGWTWREYTNTPISVVREVVSAMKHDQQERG